MTKRFVSYARQLDTLHGWLSMPQRYSTLSEANKANAQRPSSQSATRVVGVTENGTLERIAELETALGIK